MPRNRSLFCSIGRPRAGSGPDFACLRRGVRRAGRCSGPGSGLRGALGARNYRQRSVGGGLRPRVRANRSGSPTSGSRATSGVRATTGSHRAMRRRSCGPGSCRSPPRRFSSPLGTPDRWGSRRGRLVLRSSEAPGRPGLDLTELLGGRGLRVSWMPAKPMPCAVPRCWRSKRRARRAHSGLGGGPHAPLVNAGDTAALTARLGRFTRRRKGGSSAWASDPRNLPQLRALRHRRLHAHDPEAQFGPALRRRGITPRDAARPPRPRARCRSTCGARPSWRSSCLTCSK